MSALPLDGSHFGNFSNEMPAIGKPLGLGGMGGGLSKENFGNFSNGMPTLRRSFSAMKGRGFGDGPVRTRGPKSLVGQGPSGTYREYGDFSVGVQGPMPMMQTAGPESIESINRQNQEQYIPVPPGQVYQKATYGTPGLQGISQMGTARRRFNPPQQRGGMFNQPQQRGGMFNQQQPNQQGMQQMMQFMQQMMQMFSAMGGQNRGGGFGGGFGGQQQYQQPQRYQPQPRQQYQPQERTLQQQFQPVQQQYGQMGLQQPSPFAQSIRPRY